MGINPGAQSPLRYLSERGMGRGQAIGTSKAPDFDPWQSRSVLYAPAIPTL